MGQTNLHGQLLEHDGYQRIDAHGDPHLGFDRVVSGAEKVFDPFEEQFDLLATLIELGNGADATCREKLRLLKNSSTWLAL